jgi:hypothetical protein
MLCMFLYAHTLIHCIIHTLHTFVYTTHAHCTPLQILKEKFFNINDDEEGNLLSGLLEQDSDDGTKANVGA